MTHHPGNLAGKAPLGLKQPKPAKKKRKEMRKRSAKREAYLVSPERAEAVLHMAAVAELGCMVCGAPSEVHHPKPRNDMEVFPLCPPHHRREYGPGSFHYSPKAFYATHGTRAELLEKVKLRLECKSMDAWF